jgi:hypothetical protein
MHTEHLTNVRGGALVAGWLVAVAVSSLVALVFVGFDVGAVMAADIDPIWAFVLVVVGFWAGGFFVGLRVVQAPVLHGVGIGLLSLVAWVAANAIGTLTDMPSEWTSLASGFTVALLLAQFTAAVIGALMGYNIALRGKPGLSEHEPVD